MVYGPDNIWDTVTDMADIASDIRHETWVEFGVVLFFVFLRIASRFMIRQNWKFLDPEDYLMFLGMISYTALIIAINNVASLGTNVLSREEAANVLSMPEAIHKERQQGSKWLMTAEVTINITIWICKYCMLLLYSKLTLRAKCNYAVKALMIIVGISFILIQILYFFVYCRPFAEHWAIPASNPQCSEEMNYLVTTAILNIITDFMIILIPIPLLIKTQLPLKRKMLLAGLFSLGIFTIVFAILNKVARIERGATSGWIAWYSREAATAMICTNMPNIWSLCERIFKLRPWRLGERRVDTTIRTGAQASRHSFLGLSFFGRGAVSPEVTEPEPMAIYREMVVTIERHEHREGEESIGYITTISNGHIEVREDYERLEPVRELPAAVLSRI